MTPSLSEFELPAFDPNVDHFSRLGLPRSPTIARDDLESAYLALSRRVHPDRHAAAGVSAHRRAMEHAAALNEAYATLRDTVRRAEYLLKLDGIDLDSSDPKGGAPAPSQSLLIEMIDTREELTQRAGQGPAALDEMHAVVSDRADGLLARAIDALMDGAPQSAAVLLVEHRYLRRLLEEIESATDE